MNNEDDELIEEKSFKMSGNDEEGPYEDLDDPLEPGDDGISFSKDDDDTEKEESMDSY